MNSKEGRFQKMKIFEIFTFDRHLHPMTSEEKQELRQLMEAALGDVTERIGDLRELTKPIAQENAIGRVSRMDAINNKSINDAALRQAESKRKRLEYNLKRFDERDFGKCSRCQGDIPVGRLRLMPDAIRCVRCADR